MSELPEGWAEVRLGDVVDYGMAAKADPSQIDQDTWVLELEDIEKDSSKIIQRILFADRQSKSTKNQFKKGDVLYGKLRPYLNKVVIADSDGVCTTEIVPLSGGQYLDNHFLFHWLKHPNFVDYVTQVGRGVNMPRLGTEDGINAPFVLAPLAEQKVIADKLDALLAQVDTLQARLDAIPAILKRFRQSVLSEAVSGKLTEEWRRGAKPDWKASSLAELCKKSRIITYGVVKLGDEEPNGVPCLRTSNVRWLNIDVDGIKRISPTISNQYSRTILEGGEVLVNVRGTLGGVAVVPPSMKGWNISREVAVVPADSTSADPRYLALAIASEESQRWLSSVEKGVAYVGINIEDLRALPVKLPSLTEQTEIVRRVESLFAFADQIEARVQEATARVKHLTQSILAKAFRGELTEEWRKAHPELVSGENSAAALLERIRAAVPDAKGKRGRKTSSAPDSSVLMAAESAAPKKRGRPARASL